ncbi:hypothetical protein, partial [Mycoplana ramosa]
KRQSRSLAVFVDGIADEVDERRFSLNSGFGYIANFACHCFFCLSSHTLEMVVVSLAKPVNIFVGPALRRRLIVQVLQGGNSIAEVRNRNNIAALLPQ